MEQIFHMFYGSEVFNQDIGSWDVSNGTDFESMFSGATSFNQDLRSWTLKDNASLTSMFAEADLMQSNQGVGDTPSIYYFNPFPDKATLQTAIDAWINDQNSAKELYGDINKWDVSQITDFSSLFEDEDTFNSDISNWDVSNGIFFNSMFERTEFNQDISNWNVSNGTNFLDMFALASDFNQDIGSWDVSNGTNFSQMFMRQIHLIKI